MAVDEEVLVRLLGGVDVGGAVRDRARLAPKDKALLARLAVDVGRAVSTDRLIEDLWQESPPAQVRNALHVYVSHLRKVLGREALPASGNGYALLLDPTLIDAGRFGGLVSAGIRMVSAGRWPEGIDALDQALALWRGEPLADLGEYEFARIEAARLAGVHATAVQHLAEALLACGRDARLVQELGATVRRLPFNEHLRACVMTGLYRQGRIAEALEMYAEAQVLMREELGLDPGPELQSLQLAILADDPSLAGTVPEPLVGEGVSRGPAMMVPGNLTPPLTPLIGRDGELAELQQHVSDGARLLTLTGPGGVGKSRLALGLARSVKAQFPDGVFAVPLATVMDTAGVWSAIAQVLELPAEQHAPTGVVAHLRYRRVLLVLDNLEQLTDANVVVESILRQASGVVVVATSQRPVRVAGEMEHAVPALLLPVPDAPIEEVADSDAVQMFVHYAAQVRPGFVLTRDNYAAVARLCRSLDGLPLAVELAAARVKVLTPAAILARLGGLLDVALTDVGRPDRQRTLRHTVDWSFGLLDPAHQQLLTKLAVFVGGARLEAVEAVVPAEELDGHGVFEAVCDLVDASLVVATADHDDEPRFVLLETIRRYALEKLEALGERASAEDAHSQHFYERADALCANRHGGKDLLIEPFRADLGNFGELVRRRPAWVRDPRAPEERVPFTHLAALLIQLTAWARLYSVGINWAALALADDDEADLGTAASLARLCGLQFATADYAGCIVSTERARAIAAGLAAAPSAAPISLPWWESPQGVMSTAFATVAFAHVCLEDLDAARAAADLAVRSAEGQSPQHTSRALNAQLEVFMAEGDWSRADEIVERIRACDLTAGDSDWDAMWYLATKVMVDNGLGHPGQARDRAAKSMDTLVALGDPELTVWLAEVLTTTLPVESGELSARTHGSAAAYRVAHDVPNSRENQRVLDRHQERHRAHTGATAWELGISRGREEDLISLMRTIVSEPG